MAQVIIPTWKDLETLVGSAHGKLVICSPYYSESGLNHVLSSLHGKLNIKMYTRISPSDWANRISNPEALLVFLQESSDKGHSIELFVNQKLHAKIYVANRNKALVGSSNLSDGGFEQNLEMMVKLEGELARDVASLVESQVKKGAKQLTINRLQTWIRNHRKTIEKVRQISENAQARKLREAQRSLDKMLGFGRGVSAVRPVKSSDQRSFVKWLETNRDLPGAEVLIARSANLDNQNLQGHVKQCFFAVLRFLMEHPELQDQLIGDLGHMNSDAVYQLTDDVSDSWLMHIDRHATDSGDCYDYAVLRGILPPSVGGTRHGGGGGISTLKRMLPLVALYLKRK